MACPPHAACEEGLLQRVEPLGDVVLAVELVFREHPQEYVLGEDVLEQHLAHVCFGDLRADALAAQVEEVGGGGPVALVLALGLLDGLTQVFENGGQVCLELGLRLSELLDLRELVVEEAADEAGRGRPGGTCRPAWPLRGSE